MKKIVLQLVMVVSLALSPTISFGQTAPNLGAAAGFAAFTVAGAFDSNGGTLVTGDIGSYSDTPIIYAPGVVTGTIYNASSPISATVAADIHAAYLDLAGRASDGPIAVGLGGQTIIPGVHSTGAASTIAGDVTLDAQGDPNAVFIIQIDGTLITGLNSRVLLTGAASSCNVYWLVTGAFTLGDNSVFRGTLVSGGAIELLEGSSLLGRALTRAGAIHLHNNVVTTTLPPNAVTGLDRAICLNENTQLGAAAVSGNTYSWTSAPAGFTSTTANPVVTPLVTTTYTLTETITSTGCTGTNSVVVTVNPLPDTSLIYHNP